jgi:flagellar biosynthesis/type III secretory pathway M-ring protein FliF/YscJ
VIGQVLVFLVMVAAFAIVGIVVGMLVAPRLERMTEPKEEDDGDGDGDGND